MKKSVFTYKDSNGVELEILLDAGREITEADEDNIRKCADGIIYSVRDESMNLDPKVKAQAKKDKDGILALFEGRKIFVEEIPNEYAIRPYGNHFPWFVVTTAKGRIKIGWRKRVINICWDETIIEGNAKELFPEEDVTRFDKTIHAWGYDKAKEYIDKLLA